jgi:putative two-component system response regulator
MKAVLLVDDEPAVLKLISQAVQAHGVPVLCAESGPVALRTLASRDDIGLVVSDIEMPTMSGIELYAKMKSDEKLKVVPVVFMTGGQAATAPQDVYVLRKPFRLAQLAAVLSRHLGGPLPAESEP